MILSCRQAFADHVFPLLAAFVCNLHIHIEYGFSCTQPSLFVRSNLPSRARAAVRQLFLCGVIKKPSSTYNPCSHFVLEESCQKASYPAPVTLSLIQFHHSLNN